jgi:hypothetical protein
MTFDFWYRYVTTSNSLLAARKLSWIDNIICSIRICLSVSTLSGVLEAILNKLNLDGLSFLGHLPNRTAVKYEIRYNYRFCRSECEFSLTCKIILTEPEGWGQYWFCRSIKKIKFTDTKACNCFITYNNALWRQRRHPVNITSSRWIPLFIDF